MMRIYEDILVWGCIYLYAAASILLLTGFVFGKERSLRIAGAVILPAFLAHTAVFLMKWMRTGYFPAHGELENAITGGWFAIAFTIYLFIKNRAMTGVALFTVPASLLLLGYGVMKAPDPLPLNASLKSSWLLVHVLFAQLAFGAYVIATSFSIIFLLKERKARLGMRIRFYERFPDIEIIDENMFRFVVYGFIAEAIMIIAGAIWAKDLWGSYWKWDPVEVWSLVSWMLYGLALHLKITLGGRGRRFAWLLVCLLSAVIITYWGIDFMVENTRHVFGITSKGR